MEHEYYISLFFSIFLHILLLFIFLTIFYWTVILKIDSKNLYLEINKNIHSTISKLHFSPDILSDNTIKILESYYSGENETVKRNNYQLLQFNLVIIIVIFMAFLIAYFVSTSFCKQNINFFHVLGENTIFLLLAGFIEYFFFIEIASKSIAVLPSFLPSTIQKSIKNL